MSIRSWFSRRREHEDAAAVERSEEARQAGSIEEREVIRGDVEGLAADARAEAPFGEPEEDEPRR